MSTPARTAVGRVTELWRYPVKSMGGARLDAATLDPRGVHADRLWAVRDVADARTTSARRLPVLLGCTARYAREPGPDAGPGHAVPVVVTLPDGREVTGDDPAVHRLLSDLCGRAVELVALPPARERGRYRGGLVSGAAIRRELGLADDEPLPDASDMPLRTLATLARYATPPGMFADLAPVHLLTTTAVTGLGAALDADPEDTAAGEDGPGGVSVRRFRPTVVVELDDPAAADGSRYPERGWVGRDVGLGERAVLPVTMPTVRCSIPGREQPGLERRRRLNRALSSSSDRFLGVYADVARGGTVRVGDVVTVSGPTAGPLRAATGAVRRAAVRAGGRLVG